MPRPREPGVRGRGVKVDGRGATLYLEDEFWLELRRLARARGQTIGEAVSAIKAKARGRNLSSAVRVEIVSVYRAVRPERRYAPRADGHHQLARGARRSEESKAGRALALFDQVGVAKRSSDLGRVVVSSDAHAVMRDRARDLGVPVVSLAALYVEVAAREEA